MSKSLPKTIRDLIEDDIFFLTIHKKTEEVFNSVNLDNFDFSTEEGKFEFALTLVGAGYLHALQDFSAGRIQRVPVGEVAQREVDVRDN